MEQLTAYLAWMEDLDLNPANLKYVFRTPGGTYRINGLSFRRVDPLMHPMACMALIRKAGRLYPIPRSVAHRPWPCVMIRSSSARNSAASFLSGGTDFPTLVWQIDLSKTGEFRSETESRIQNKDVYVPGGLGSRFAGSY